MKKLTIEYKKEVINKLNNSVEILQETFKTYGLRVDTIGCNIPIYSDNLHFYADIVVENKSIYPTDDGITLYVTLYDKDNKIIGRYDDYIENNIDEYNNFFTIDIGLNKAEIDIIDSIAKIKFYCNRYM